jgi:23S rRNA pseudouridine2605 synthase
MSEKLQKVLARAGLGSRREIETWITAGRVRVNNAIAKLGDRVELTAKIQVDERVVNLNPLKPVKSRVLLYHKPVGEICARHDPEGRPTVFDKLPNLRNQRWIVIGRLDFNTAGLLLFTNNGDLAHRLMHPSYEIEREYAVRVLGEVKADVLQRLRQGVELDDGPANFDDIRDAGGDGANHWYHVILREGRNREVRRLWESQNIVVSRLIRVRFANIQLPRFLRAGKHADLEPEQIDELMQMVKL